MLAAILLAELTLFVGLTQTGSGDSSRVVGRVMCHSHSQTVPHAKVVAISDSEVAETQADGHGRYAFLTLLPGAYQLIATTPACSDFARCEDLGWTGAIYDVTSAAAVTPRVTHEWNDAGNFVELSAGVEYLANIAVAAPCR
jgi:hypothetical protein